MKRAHSSVNRDQASVKESESIHNANFLSPEFHQPLQRNLSFNDLNKEPDSPISSRVGNYYYDRIEEFLPQKKLERKL